MGKTTMVQKIVHDWAAGEIYQQFRFVFSFRFRDLSSLDCRMNLRELVLDQYPYFGNTLGEVWEEPEKLFFIFDGLDEFRDGFDFADGRRDPGCTDPEFRCKVSDIVYSLIQGELLPGCSVLVTTRPTALPLLEKADIGAWAEIRGLVGEKRREYFSKYFEDPAVAAGVFEHVEGYETLSALADNPTHCLILALALGPYFSLSFRDPQRLLRLVTPLPSYCLYNILRDQVHELRSPCDLLLRLCRAALAGPSGSPVIFTEGDLIELRRPPSRLPSRDPVQMCTFPYLTVQEFAAALAEFLSPDPGDVLNLLAEARGKADGRFETLLCFAAALGATGSAWLLGEFLGPPRRRPAGWVTLRVREEVELQVRGTWSEAGKQRLLGTLGYLSESGDGRPARGSLGSAEALSFRGLPLAPTDCAVLSRAVRLCDAVGRLDLKGCRIEGEGFRQLGPGLHKCQELRLGFNSLGDSAGEVVSEALRVPGCQIQRLWLCDVGLTAAGAKDLASALGANRSLRERDPSYNILRYAGVRLLAQALRDSACKLQSLGLNPSNLKDAGVNRLSSALRTNRSLLELDVRGNRLGDSGVRLLAAALREPGCKLQTLGLFNVGLTAAGAKDLASALGANRSLRELDLGGNDLGDSGVRLVAEALRDPRSTLQTLDLTRISLTNAGAEDLASVLRTNRSLRELDLSYNTLGDSGVRLLAQALRDSACKLQSLGLTCNDLTAACAEDLASAVGANPSLAELRLGMNELGDAGVNVLAAALREQGRGQQKLRLDENGLTGSCVKDLAAALGTGSTLTVLDLSYNHLGDWGVRQLSRALRSRDCKLEKLRLRAVGLTAPFVRHLASAVKACRSLVELDLGWNELRDSGAKQLTLALRGAGCRLQKLGLYAARLTDSCTNMLVSALGLNRSVTQLNLGSNSFTDQSVPSLCCLVQSRKNLQWLELWENQFSAEGQEQLLALQGIRSGLRVELQRSYDP